MREVRRQVLREGKRWPIVAAGTESGDIDLARQWSPSVAGLLTRGVCLLWGAPSEEIEMSTLGNMATIGPEYVWSREEGCWKSRQ